MWRQKSKVKWLNEGDRNSKFFHFLANGRRRSNYVGEIVIDGVRTTDPKMVKDGVRSLFKNQFQNVLGKGRASQV